MQQASQQKKLIIILALIVMLPLALLAWQGWKISKDTEQLNDARFNSLVTARLNQVDTIIQSYFEEMQLKWSLLIPQWQLDNESTRKRIENDGNIRQIFVIDAQKLRRFPPRDNEITAAEKTFVDRLESVWRDPQVLFSDQYSTPDAEQIASRKNSNKKSLNSIVNADVASPAAVDVAANAPIQAEVASISKRSASPSKTRPASRQGWYMWYWGKDANLIFWQQNADNSIVGVEMEPIRVKSDLISRLPDTTPDDSANDFRLRLQDNAGNVVYQWGNYEIIDSKDIAQQ